ncbi:hypothetical protein D9M71_413280 [compost metagenome]
MRLAGIQPLQVIDAIAPALLQQTLQRRVLLLVGGHDQLAEALIADATFVAECVEALLALHAQLSLEAAAGVIDTGVDHFGIARTDALANPSAGLDQDHFATAHGQGPGHRQAHYPGPDHHAVDINAHQTSPRSR